MGRQAEVLATAGKEKRHREQPVARVGRSFGRFYARFLRRHAKAAATLTKPIAA
jgi:hypothetical protein